MYDFQISENDFRVLENDFLMYKIHKFFYIKKF